jgi:hypothetical protein
MTTAIPARLTDVATINHLPTATVPAPIAAASSQATAGSRCGTFSQAELTTQRVITVRYPIFRRGIIFGRPGRHHSPGATSAWQVRPPRVARRELAPPRSSWPYLATVEAAQ